MTEEELLNEFRQALNLKVTKITILQTGTYSISAYGKHPIRIRINDDLYEMSSHISYDVGSQNPFVGSQMNVYMEDGDSITWDRTLNINVTQVGE